MKKKKIVAILVVMLSAIISAMAQAGYYSNHGDMSVALYSGKTYEMDLDYTITQFRNEYIRINKTSGRTTYKITKLTEYEKQLLKNALYEYRLEKGDVYTVTIGESSANGMPILKIVVRIDSVYNNGRSWDYAWWSIGKVYSNEF